VAAPIHTGLSIGDAAQARRPAIRRWPTGCSLALVLAMLSMACMVREIAGAPVDGTSVCRSKGIDGKVPAERFTPKTRP
jgi:hypothetical protein